MKSRRCIGTRLKEGCLKACCLWGTVKPWRLQEIYDGKTSKFLLFPGRLCLRHVIVLAWLKSLSPEIESVKRKEKNISNAGHRVQKKKKCLNFPSDVQLISPKCISSAQARKHKWQVSLGVDWCAQMMFPSLSPDARKVSTVRVVGGK